MPLNGLRHRGMVILLSRSPRHSHLAVQISAVWPLHRPDHRGMVTQWPSSPQCRQSASRVSGAFSAARGADTRGTDWRRVDRSRCAAPGHVSTSVTTADMMAVCEGHRLTAPPPPRRRPNVRPPPAHRPPSAPRSARSVCSRRLYGSCGCESEGRRRGVTCLMWRLRGECFCRGPGNHRCCRQGAPGADKVASQDGQESW